MLLSPNSNPYILFVTRLQKKVILPKFCACMNHASFFLLEFSTFYRQRTLYIYRIKKFTSPQQYLAKVHTQIQSIVYTYAYTYIHKLTKTWEI